MFSTQVTFIMRSNTWNVLVQLFFATDVWHVWCLLFYTESLVSHYRWWSRKCSCDEVGKEFVLFFLVFLSIVPPLPRRTHSHPMKWHCNFRGPLVLDKNEEKSLLSPLSNTPFLDSIFHSGSEKVVRSDCCHHYITQHGKSASPSFESHKLACEWPWRSLFATPKKRDLLSWQRETSFLHLPSMFNSFNWWNFFFLFKRANENY